MGKSVRIETIKDCTLYLGDTLEIVPSLGECADCVVTDPPYKLTSGGGVPQYDGARRMGGCFNNELYNNDGNLVECDIDWEDFMPILYGSLRGNAHAYVMSSYRHIGRMYEEAEKAGFRLHNLLPWDKGTATPSRQYMRNYEFTGMFFKGAAKTINDPGAKAGVYVAQEDYAGHPTTKPVGLMEYYVLNSTVRGETVIDPFMGVGATAIACARNGRKFIGVEIEERWFDAACRRVELFYNSPKQLALL